MLQTSNPQLFEISPDAYRYGMGFYCATRSTMDYFRAAIDAKPQQFQMKVAAMLLHKRFVIMGDEYKRPLRTDLPPELLTWYNRKNVYLLCERPLLGDSLGRELLDEVRQGFETVAPLYHLFCTAAE